MFTNTEFEILKLTYCGFSAKVVGKDKVVYCWRFPPANKITNVPNFETISSSEDLRPDSHVYSDVFSDFVKSNQIRQVNGSWKGGSWGTNNFTVTSSIWFSGMYVGDRFMCTHMHTGTVKYSTKPFESSQIIIPGSEKTSWSCNGTWNGVTYALYMTDDPMPQKATDKLWMWGTKNGSNLRIKVLKRGTGPDVDCGGTIIPAAGEHLGPEQSDDAREQALFSFNEEIGIPSKTLSKCYLLDLGTYDSDGRDSRYWLYSVLQDGQNMTCGIKRKSSSIAHIVYIETDDDVEPEETEQEDKEEIKAKWWENVYNMIAKYPESKWMLEDHMKFIPDSIARIKKFRVLSPEEKANYKF